MGSFKPLNSKESLKVMVEKCRSEDKGKFKGGSVVANAVERREGRGEA